MRYIFLLLVFILISCSKSIEQNGYIVFVHPECWSFLPLKDLKMETSISSFYTKNIKIGQCIGGDIYMDSIFAHIDTFEVYEIHKNKSKDKVILKILPAKIKYQIIKKQKDYQKSEYIIRNDTVRFYVNCSEIRLDTLILLGVQKKNLIGKYSENWTTCPRKK